MHDVVLSHLFCSGRGLQRGQVGWPVGLLGMPWGMARVGARRVKVVRRREVMVKVFMLVVCGGFGLMGFWDRFVEVGRVKMFG